MDGFRANGTNRWEGMILHLFQPDSATLVTVHREPTRNFDCACGEKLNLYHRGHRGTQGNQVPGVRWPERNQPHTGAWGWFIAPRLLSTFRISPWSKSAKQPPCRTEAEPRERSLFAMPRRLDGPGPGHPQEGCRQEFRELFFYCSAK